jgi:hypothetical protein
MHKTFSKGGNLYLGIPLDLNIIDLIKVLKFIPSFTIKRKLYKIYVFWVITLFKILRITKDNESLLEIDSIISKNPMFLGIKYMVVWSLVPNRKRCYIYFYDSNRELVYFGKLSQKTKDYDLLRNEYDFLLNYKTQKANTQFQTPSVIYFKEVDDYSFLVVESLSNECKLFHPEKNDLSERVYNSLNSNKVTHDLDKCYTQNWWINFLVEKDRTIGLYNYIVSNKGDSKISLSFIHGDLGSENIFKNNLDQLYIIDWERSCKMGPHLTDRVAFWLGKNHNNDNHIIGFNEFFKQEKKLDLYLALCFLVSANFDLAIKISKRMFND